MCVLEITPMLHRQNPADCSTPRFDLTVRMYENPDDNEIYMAFGEAPTANFWRTVAGVNEFFIDRLTFRRTTMPATTNIGYVAPDCSAANVRPQTGGLACRPTTAADCTTTQTFARRNVPSDNSGGLHDNANFCEWNVSHDNGGGLHDNANFCEWNVPCDNGGGLHDNANFCEWNVSGDNGSGLHDNANFCEWSVSGDNGGGLYDNANF